MASLRDPVGTLELDIRADLERVEATLHDVIRSDQSKVNEAARYLIDAGGKRFRPTLTLLAGYTGDPKDERLVPCAAAIELTHLATLYHDDVIDETTIRRGVPTVNVRYGNNVAVLTGDFLLARASGLAADLGAYVSRRLADTIAELCEGQIMESELAGSLDAPPASYIEVIRRKTASLIATSCHLGAWLARAPDETVAALTDYGEALGMAFQLTDDILDVVGYEEATGKHPGTDLAAGVYTLPVLETMRGTIDGAADLAAALERKDIAAALTILRSNGSIGVAKDAAVEWASRARAALEGLPDGGARATL
ncbi:MAG TPA: polyprenyl synthetase family protein, partial [Actinomycetota bacterium]|nr:polyprenyl synthetase family protein [Actinomycetota bacterium]